MPSVAGASMTNVRSAEVAIESSNTLKASTKYLYVPAVKGRAVEVKAAKVCCVPPLSGVTL